MDQLFRANNLVYFYDSLKAWKPWSSVLIIVELLQIFIQNFVRETYIINRERERLAQDRERGFEKNMPRGEEGRDMQDKQLPTTFFYTLEFTLSEVNIVRKVTNPKCYVKMHIIVLNFHANSIISTPKLVIFRPHFALVDRTQCRRSGENRLMYAWRQQAGSMASIQDVLS